MTLLRPPVIKLLEKPFRLRDLRAIIEAALDSRAERRVAGVLSPLPAITGDHGRAGDKRFVVHNTPSLKKQTQHVRLAQ